MKKTCIALFFAAAVLLSTLVSALAEVDPLGLLLDGKFKIGGKSYDTLSAAFAAAKDGDTITKDNTQEQIYTASEGISVTKKVTLSTGRDLNDNVCSISYTGTSGPLFTIENGGVLTLKDAVITGNTNSTLSAGGLVRVKAGGTLILDGTSALPVVIKNCKLTAVGAKGGAIYVEQGGRVIVRGVTFQNNSAGKGKDIYTQSRADVILYSGVTANIAAGETASSASLLAKLSERVAKIDCKSVLSLAADADGDGVYTAADMVLLARNMIA